MQKGACQPRNSAQHNYSRSQVFGRTIACIASVAAVTQPPCSELDDPPTAYSSLPMVATANEWRAVDIGGSVDQSDIHKSYRSSVFKRAAPFEPPTAYSAPSIVPAASSFRGVGMSGRSSQEDVLVSNASSNANSPWPS